MSATRTGLEQHALAAIAAFALGEDARARPAARHLRWLRHRRRELLDLGQERVEWHLGHVGRQKAVCKLAPERVVELAQDVCADCGMVELVGLVAGHHLEREPQAIEAVGGRGLASIHATDRLAYQRRNG